ncbi:MAG: hypothetical protein KGJ62_14900 [Armatimonadetes bacterium]|nr:hypothetical protein [Armatimonadota bacterium]MDE2206173.1 hypothetical protein [Armatimonadota bacterium]
MHNNRAQQTAAERASGLGMRAGLIHDQPFPPRAAVMPDDINQAVLVRLVEAQAAVRGVTIAPTATVDPAEAKLREGAREAGGK